MSGTIKDIDREIAKAKFLLGSKQEELDKIGRKLQLSEREKIYLGRETDLINVVKSLMNRCKNEIHTHLGKIPPSAVDLEESILGALILEKEAISVIGFLKPEHFYNESHALIFTAISDLHTTSKPVDMQTVTNQLRLNGHIEIVGGASYIAGLTSRVASAANILYHSAVVIEFAMKRKMIEIGSELVNCGYDDRKDAFELMDFGIEGLNEIKSWAKK